MLKTFTFICLLWDTLLFYSRTVRTICLFFLLHFTASLRMPRILIVPLDSQRSQMTCANIWLGIVSVFLQLVVLIVNGDGRYFTALCPLEHEILLMAVYFLSFSHALKSCSSLSSLSLFQKAAVHLTVCMETAILLRKEWGGAVVGRRG